MLPYCSIIIRIPGYEEEYSKLQHFSNSMMSLQAMSCTQSAMAPPTGPAPSGAQYRETQESVKYTQLDFAEPDSPTESSVRNGVDNHHIVRSNAWFVNPTQELTFKQSVRVCLCVCVRVCTCVCVSVYVCVSVCMRVKELLQSIIIVIIIYQSVLI